MPKEFTKLPIEEDTKVLYQKEEKLGGFDVRYEIWSWEGYRAESLIFSNEDVSNLTDAEIEQIVRKSPYVYRESTLTLNRSTNFIFVNFNFE